MTATPTDPIQPDDADPLLALVRRVPAQVQALIAAEVQLATAEVRYNIGRLVLAIAIILAGGIVAGAAGIALLAALIESLAPYVGTVGSALITAAVALLCGGVLIAAGVSQIRSRPIAPKRAIANLKSHADAINFLKLKDSDDDR